jgi:lysozyme family protein
VDAFVSAFDTVIGVEGGYSNNPADSGGATMYGITEVVARSHGYVGDMRSMPLGVAQAIYRAQYWNLLHLDDVANANQQIALEVFDSAVNCGVGTVGRWLQRALNAFNQQGRDYPDVEVDGVVGPMTLAGLRRLLAARGDRGVTALLRALNCQQGSYYLDLAERRPANEAFEFGWFSDRVTI